MNLLQLRTQVSNILNRNDATPDQLNTFIAQAQTRIERTLRVPGMERIGVVTGNADPATDQIVIPQDFLSLQTMYTEGDCGGLQELQFKERVHFFRLQQQNGLGGLTPRYYTRIGASYLITPVLPAGNSVTLVYYGSQPSLSADTDTNLWSDVMADLLIYGALSYAADYFVDDRAGSFEARFTQIYGDVEEQGSMTDMDNTSMAISPAYNTEY